jgi:hypothetical protein
MLVLAKANLWPLPDRLLRRLWERRNPSLAQRIRKVLVRELPEAFDFLFSSRMQGGTSHGTTHNR